MFGLTTVRFGSPDLRTSALGVKRVRRIDPPRSRDRPRPKRPNTGKQFLYPPRAGPGDLLSEDLFLKVSVYPPPSCTQWLHGNPADPLSGKSFIRQILIRQILYPANPYPAKRHQNTAPDKAFQLPPNCLTDLRGPSNGPQVPHRPSRSSFQHCNKKTKIEYTNRHGGIHEDTLCTQTFRILAQVSPNLPNPLPFRSSTPWTILKGKATWADSSPKGPRAPGPEYKLITICRAFDPSAC